MKMNFNNWNFNFITDWTVRGISWVYRLIVQNVYFVLSNFLFIAMLLLFQLNLNNFILFIVPIFLFYVSLAAQFKTAEAKKDIISLRRYGQIYRDTLKNNWKVFLFYTGVTTFIAFDVKVLLVLNGALFLIPLSITVSFLASGMFFVFLLSTDERAKRLPVGRKFFSMLLVSYKLPLVTLINVLWFSLMIVTLQQFSLAYLVFFAGAINYMIYLNLKRRFSVELYFEQMEKL